MSIFECTSYISFLERKIKEKNTRGYKSQLAEAAGCKLSYLSQVLKGQVQLTPEHALGLTDHLKLPSIEREYFLTLVLRERAGTRQLRNYYTAQLETFKKDSLQVTKHIPSEEVLTIQTEGVLEYYTSWHFGAIRVALSIPELRSIEKIANRLSLSHRTVEDALTKLAKLGLVEKVKDSWFQTKKNIHASGLTLASTLNHLQWRQKNLVTLQGRPSDGVHYTAVSSLCRSDIEKINKILIDAIKETREVVDPSKEEELVVLTIDFDLI